MASRTSGSVLLLTLLLALAACGEGEAASRLEGDFVPPLSVPSSTTTTTLPPPPLEPAEADRRARELIRAVAGAARQVLAEYGTYQVDRAELGVLADGVEVISLEEAAMREGVVYQPFGKRVTLHIRSTSGRWFCLDLSPAGEDYGFGNDFPSSLASCTDGVIVAGWGDVYSPSGPHEAAIAGVWESLALALERGDPPAAHELFAATAGCRPEDLAAVWPPGVPLMPADAHSLDGVEVTGTTARSRVTLGTLPASDWLLESDGSSWLIAADPCAELGRAASEPVEAAARNLIESGLFAVRSVFVAETSFAFTTTPLEAVDGDLVWVEPGALAFGRLSYTGTEGAGVVATEAAGRYLCAVESSGAGTRYGEGTALEEVSISACGR